MEVKIATKNKANTQGILLTLASTVFFGMAPIFGKLAFRAQVIPFTLVMLRTVGAAVALWLFYLLFWRQAIRIDANNLMGCIGMGLANGIGSLLYYSGLGRIDASLAQLLYTLYPIWVFIFLIAAGHHISRMSIVRLGLALAGVIALTYSDVHKVDWLGVMLLISSGALYAWHLVLGQWTLVDVDSRTVALYTLTTMALVTAVARLLNSAPWTPISSEGWLAIIGLTIFPTILARLLMFAGLQSLGGVQTSLLGLAELLITLLVAFIWLGERLTLLQWLGGVLLVASVWLGRRESDLVVNLKELLDEGRWRELVD